MKGYDYSKLGLYFITICTHQKMPIFGDIESDKMVLNKVGQFVDDCWLDIPNHFPNVVLHEYVIMPNHVHGIIELHTIDGGIANGPPTENGGDATVGVENFQPQQCTRNILGQTNEFQKLIPKSIGSIVKGFKIGVTKWCRNNTEIHIVLQRNYYDRIIRDESSYQRIIQYIRDNPAKWADDRLNG